MSLFASVKSRVDALRQRINKKALVVPQAVVKTPVQAVKPVKVPYTSTVEVKTVDFKLSPALTETIYSHRECKSHEKMNNTRKHRNQMKKHNKRMRKMNVRHGIRS